MNNDPPEHERPAAPRTPEEIRRRAEAIEKRHEEIKKEILGRVQARVAMFFGKRDGASLNYGQAMTLFGQHFSREEAIQATVAVAAMQMLSTVILAKTVPPLGQWATPLLDKVIAGVVGEQAGLIMHLEHMGAFQPKKPLDK